jgi:hypothetical protein
LRRHDVASKSRDDLRAAQFTDDYLEVGQLLDRLLRKDVQELHPPDPDDIDHAGMP